VDHPAELVLHGEAWAVREEALLALLLLLLLLLALGAAHLAVVLPGGEGRRRGREAEGDEVEIVPVRSRWAGVERVVRAGD
jgi:hypothetical protein